MSDRIPEFARIAKAERQLCDEAGPVLTAIIGSIAARAGLAITEIRVTFDPLNGSVEFSTANCTIVRARNLDGGDGHDIQPAKASGNGSGSAVPNRE